MPGDFISILVACIAVLIFLALLLAGVDIYFDISAAIDFSSAFTMNIIFTLSSGFIMFMAFLLVISKETQVMKYFHSLNNGFYTGLLISSIIMYFVKDYLLTKYEVVFNHSWLILSFETLALLIVPYVFYRILKTLIDNLAHAH